MRALFATLARPALRQRGMATAATTVTPYPFSKTVKVTPPPAELASSLLLGKNLMNHIDKNLPTPAARNFLDTYFSRKSSERVLPGSVLSVTLSTAPASFAGVLISVRHKGNDTSFTLRNIVQRTGIEMRFPVSSPMIKDIKVIQRAGGPLKQGRRMRRAKLYYLRDQPGKMSAISATVRKTLQASA